MEELEKLDFQILGVYSDDINVEKYDEQDFLKIDDKLKKAFLIKDFNRLSTNNLSKLQFLLKRNDNIIKLYDFSKGLNNKELKYFKLIFKKLNNSLNKKIVLFSKDVSFLVNFCDKIVIYSDHIIYQTNDVFDDKLYEYMDMPKIISFIKYSNSLGIKLKNTLDLNELIKDIYRSQNENKNGS